MTKITLLDGGMGQELIHRAGDRPTPLWSTQVMMDHPGMVEAVHEDYFRAGSGIATTNTYCIHHDRLVKTGIDGKFEELHEAAVEEAKAARKAAGHGKIAGSIGPLVASYRPDVHPPHDEAVAKYAEVARKLAPHVDFLLCETVASVAHARSILEGAKTAGKPVWLSVTVDDEDGARLRSGEPVAEVVGIAKEGGADALLANCSAPEAMEAALAALADKVAARLRAQGLWASCIGIKVRRADFTTLTRQRTLTPATCETAVIAATTRELLAGWLQEERRGIGRPQQGCPAVRLLGVSATALEDAAQEDLFAVADGTRGTRLDSALDAIRDRFGGAAVSRASSLGRTRR